MKYLDDDIQTFLAEAGEAGCYTLCLIDVACEYLQMKLDVIDALKVGIEKGCIHYNPKDRNDNDNFYVEYPARFLELMTGRHWTVCKSTPFYRCKKNEYLINRWERKKTGIVTGHFDRDNFHPILDSQTIKYGEIASVRVCTVME